MSVSEELMCEGYGVEGVRDAESVSEYLRSLRPDLVLLDLYLDGPDGWEVLRDIKKQDPYLSVIIFTAYDSFVDDPRLSEADGYVIKSIDLDELKQKIADVLNRKSARVECFRNSIVSYPVIARLTKSAEAIPACLGLALAGRSLALAGRAIARNDKLL